jgi:hypothetical protein
VTADDDRNVQVFDCGVCGSLADLKQRARSQVKRGLTAEERRTYVDGDDG